MCADSRASFRRVSDESRVLSHTYDKSVTRDPDRIRTYTSRACENAAAAAQAQNRNLYRCDQFLIIGGIVFLRLLTCTVLQKLRGADLVAVD